MANLSGKEIGKYRITERIGRGGMAEVYKGVHTHLDRQVAIKVLHGYLLDDGDFLTRFKREAKAVANLRHPNIVQVYDFDIQDDIIFMVMEYIDGTDLQSQMVQLDKEGKHLSIKEIGSIIKDIASALDYAHSRGMLHRDVKPSNILIDKNNKAYLTDFGIARLLTDQKLTATGTLIGTPAYMSPEQGRGEEVSRESDIYSLGVVAFELITGQVPYDAQTPIAIVQKQIADPIPDLRKFVQDVPDSAQEVIETALAKSPEKRYPSAEALVVALRGALEALEASDASLKISQAPGVAQDEGLFAPTVEMEEAAVQGDEVEMATVMVEGESEAQTAATEEEQLEAPREGSVPGGVKSARKIPVWGYIAGAVGFAAIVAVVLIQVLGGSPAPSTPAASEQPTEIAVVIPTEPVEPAPPVEPMEPVVYDGPRTILAAPGTSVGLSVFEQNGGDADIELIEVDGQHAWRTGNGQAVGTNSDPTADFYMLVAVDDEVLFEGFPTSDVQIEIVYLDEGTDVFRIEYDAVAGGQYGDGTFKETDWFEKTGSGEFRSAVFNIDDANFMNRIQGADFRINDNSDGAETIRRIGVTLLGLPAGTTGLGEGDSRAYFDDAVSRRENGDFTAALELIEQALALEPTNAEYNWLKGEILWFGFEDRQAAEDILNLAVELAAPDQSYIFHARGLFYLMTDRCELSVPDYTIAIEFDQGNPYLFLERGQCFEKLGEVDLAREDFSIFMEMTVGDAAFEQNRQEVQAWLDSH